MNNYFVKSSNYRKLEDIYKFISKQEFDLIFEKVGISNKEHYFNAICCCIDEMYDVQGLEKVVRKYVQEIREDSNQFSRSFIHLMIGYKLKRYNQLKEVETNNISYDFVLNNGLKIELTRERDFERIVKKRILKEIKKIPLLKDLFLTFYIKTSGIDDVVKKIKSEIKGPPFRELENEYFDLVIQPEGQFFGALPNKNIDGILQLSTGPGNNLGIQFKAKSISLIDLILKKNTKEACRNSDILIVDLTDDLSIIGKNTLDEELIKIDSEVIPSNLKIIILMRFFWSENIIKAELKYRVFCKDDVVDEFEKDFLQKDGLYEGTSV